MRGHSPWRARSNRPAWPPVSTPRADHVPLLLLVAGALLHDGRRKERARARRRVEVDARQRAAAMAVGRKLLVKGPVALGRVLDDDVRVDQDNVLVVVTRRTLCFGARVAMGLDT